MLTDLVTRWNGVPGFARDFIEGALAAGAGAAYLAFQGTNWSDPSLSFKGIGMVLVSAFVGGVLGFVRHRVAKP